MATGAYEFDDRGRGLFRPDMPSFPRLGDVYGVLDPASTALREFDRRLAALHRTRTVGRLFGRLDAVHASGAEGSTTTFTVLMEYETKPSSVEAPCRIGAASRSI